MNLTSALTMIFGAAAGSLLAPQASVAGDGGDRAANAKVIEHVLGKMDRPYGSNPYTPDGTVSRHLTRLFTWGAVAALDGTPLIFPRQVSPYLSNCVFSSTGATLLFQTTADAQSFVYREENGRLSEYGPYKRVAELCFSQDGRHFLFAAEEARQGWSIWVDGTKRTAFLPSHPIAAFYKGDAVAYAVAKDGQWRVYENERLISGPWDDVSDIHVSLSNRIALCVKKRKQAFVVVDGKEEGPYDSAHAFGFDRSGGHYAYVAKHSEGKQCVVADGAEGQSYEEIRVPPVFSPGGKSLAYVAQRTPNIESGLKVLPDGTQVMTSVERPARECLVIVNETVRHTGGYSGINLIGEPGLGISNVCVNDSGGQFVYVDVVPGTPSPRFFSIRVSGSPVTWPCRDFIPGGEPKFVAENIVRFAAIKHGEAGVPTVVYDVEVALPARLGDHEQETSLSTESGARSETISSTASSKSEPHPSVSGTASGLQTAPKVTPQPTDAVAGRKDPLRRTLEWLRGTTPRPIEKK